MKILMPGGSGFCGRLLTDYLVRQGHSVTILSRSAHAVKSPCNTIVWDGKSQGPWIGALEGADAVVNLTGRSVNCRYNAANCSEIYASRLDSTAILGTAMAAVAHPPAVWLNAASATIYRHAEDREMDEETGEIGVGFSVDVCKQWEATLFSAPIPQTRRVAMRSAMVFSGEPGGAFDAYANLVRLRLGGPAAGGLQYVSWIHGVDFCRAVEWLLRADQMEGPVNLAAPAPLSNLEFMRVLRRALGVRLGFPLPTPLLQMGAVLLKTEIELVVKSRRVVPRLLSRSGFRFAYPTWTQAAEAIVKQRKDPVYFAREWPAIE